MTHGATLLQVTAQLQLAQLWEQNGTHMAGVGVQCRDHTVLVAIDAGDNPTGGRAALICLCRTRIATSAALFTYNLYVLAVLQCTWTASLSTWP